jgi:hypothetical protein
MRRCGMSMLLTVTTLDPKSMIVRLIVYQYKDYRLRDVIAK